MASEALFYICRLNFISGRHTILEGFVADVHS